MKMQHKLYQERAQVREGPSKRGYNQLLEVIEMKSHLYRLSLLGSFLAVLSLNCALANDVATDEIYTGSIPVAFDDLNLDSPVGLDSLYRRVEFAARKVCGVGYVKVSLDIVRRNRECVSGSIEHAIEQIGDTRLAALHQSRLMTENKS